MDDNWTNLFFDRGTLAISPDGATAGCHLCGRWFAHLGAHVKRTHGIEAAEYRTGVGLMVKTKLISPRLADKRRLTIQNTPSMRDNLRGRDYLRSLSFAERSKHAKARKISEQEQNQRLAHVAVMQRAAQVAAAKRSAAFRLESVRVCKRCHATYVLRRRLIEQQYCSRACYWSDKGDSPELQALRERRSLQHNQRLNALCTVCGSTIGDQLSGTSGQVYYYLRLGVCSAVCRARRTAALRVQRALTNQPQADGLADVRR